MTNKSKRNFKWRSCLALMLATLFICISNLSYAYTLPNLGDPSSVVISQAEQQKLGREFMRSVKSQLPILHDSIINDYITHLGRKLVAYNPNHRGKHFSFFVVADPEINAFSGPAGHVGVNTGLILTTQSESELAAVMSHEIAHVTQQHILRSIAAAKHITIPAAAALLAAVAIGAVSHDHSLTNAGTGAALATAAGTTQGMINFTRANEAEADSVGIETLYRAGFNPNAMPEFFRRMQRANMAYGTSVPELLLTHPVTEERIAEAENRAAQYKNHKVVTNPAYWLIKARLRILLSINKNAILDHYQDLYAKIAKAKKSSNLNQAITYGYALSLANLKAYKKAKTIFSQLVKSNAQQPIFILGLAACQTHIGQSQNALKLLKQLIHRKPNYYPAIYRYAQTLIYAKQYPAAQQFLRTELVTYDHKIALYNLLLEAYAKNFQQAQAYITRAKIFELQRNYKAAIIQLQQAKKIPGLSHNNRLIIEAKLPELKKLYLENKPARRKNIDI